MTGRKLLFALSLLLLALAPVRALATELKAQSSTQYLWYNDPFQDKTQGDLLQYVKLSAPPTTTSSSQATREPTCTTGGTRHSFSTTR